MDEDAKALNGSLHFFVVCFVLFLFLRICFLFVVVVVFFLLLSFFFQLFILQGKIEFRLKFLNLG